MSLPGDKQVEAKAEDAGSDDVRRVVTRTIQMLRNPAQKRRKPILAVRNLYRLLDEEQFPNIEKLNDALWKHWTALWKVCARGHYSAHRKPLREKVPSETNDEDFELAVQPALPSLEEGGYRLDLVREEGNEFSPRLQFPGTTVNLDFVRSGRNWQMPAIWPKDPSPAIATSVGSPVSRCMPDVSLGVNNREGI
jgi:hypothetical protein